MGIFDGLKAVVTSVGKTVSAGVQWVSNAFKPATTSGTKVGGGGGGVFGDEDTSSSSGSGGGSSGSGGGSSGDTGSGSGDGSTSSTDNTAENVKKNDPEKNKTLAEIRMSEELRETFSLIITVPLIMEKVHTNQFFFMAVTDDFYDNNYPEIMEIIASKKFGRYAGFVKGRFFIDKVVQKGGVDGFSTELTLNPIAPSHGTYVKMQQEAEKALIQALNDNTTYQGTNGSGVGGSINSTDLIEIGNILGNKYTFCGRVGSESYTSMKQRGCGSCFAWSGALYTELTAKGYTVRVIQYGTSMADNHRSVQVQNNGVWEDYPYRQTTIHKYAWNYSHPHFSIALDENGKGATNIL